MGTCPSMHQEKGRGRGGGGVMTGRCYICFEFNRLGLCRPPLDGADRTSTI